MNKAILISAELDTIVTNYFMISRRQLREIEIERGRGRDCMRESERLKNRV